MCRFYGDIKYTKLHFRAPCISCVVQQQKWKFVIHYNIATRQLAHFYPSSSMFLSCSHLITAARQRQQCCRPQRRVSHVSYLVHCIYRPKNAANASMPNDFNSFGRRVCRLALAFWTINFNSLFSAWKIQNF